MNLVHRGKGARSEFIRKYKLITYHSQGERDGSDSRDTATKA